MSSLDLPQFSVHADDVLNNSDIAAPCWKSVSGEFVHRISQIGKYAYIIEIRISGPHVENVPASSLTQQYKTINYAKRPLAVGCNLGIIEIVLPRDLTYLNVLGDCMGAGRVSMHKRTQGAESM